MSRFGGRWLGNVLAVARRELVYRIRTRAYRLTTVVLVLAGVGLSLAPTIIAYLTRDGSGDRIEVVAGDSAPSVDVVAAFNSILNASAGGVPGVNLPGQSSQAAFNVIASTDLAQARQHVLDGGTAAAIALGRTGGDLTFTVYSKDGNLSRRTAIIRQAAISIAIQDRLNTAGIPPIDQAHLFATPQFDLANPDPNATGKTKDPGEDAAAFLTGFGLSIAIFMAIILYGQWIAYSVAEEKNSRVMEIVLAAATPFQLLAGKVIGVGALAMLQYVIVTIPMIVALLFQGQIAAALLGSGGTTGAAGGVDLASGLTVPMLVTFGIMFVLGFTVYASLYAGAASLVSRQEDINQIVAPLTIVSVLGYLVATYSSTGLIPIDSPLVVVLSYIPLFSPYLMLTRLSQGTAGLLDVSVAIGLLLITIPAALWLAGRLYRSGVLMYGQSPSPRTLWKALRAG
jgi:ABC-2 type transport system permease protein